MVYYVCKCMLIVVHFNYADPVTIIIVSRKLSAQNELIYICRIRRNIKYKEKRIYGCTPAQSSCQISLRILHTREELIP